MGYREARISSGRNKISATIHEPSGSGEISKIAVLTPGYLDSKDYPDMAELGKALSAKGYLAVSFDPTGTWKSEGEIGEYTATQILGDIQSVVEYLNDQAGEFVQELVVLGHSLGATISIIYGSRSRKVSGVVAIMPPQSFVRPEKLETKITPWKINGAKLSTRDFPGNSALTREFNVPYSFIEDVMQYDAADAAGLIHVPILIMAGSEDKTITPAHVRPIYEAANGPKKLVVLEGVIHDYRKSAEDTIAVNHHIMEFLEDHNL